MLCKEECIEFENKDGLLLRGILHHGNEVEHKKVSLICLNTGLNDMVGWHRLQVKVARFLADNGYNVLRFDDVGIGDSDGELDEESIVNIFASIETGLFILNADAAIDFTKKKFPDGKLVHLGFCGGGLTAFHSAATKRDVAGVIDIGGPVTLSSAEYLDKKDPWEVKKQVEKYKSKLFDPHPWIRFFTGKGEYSNIFKSVTHYVKHKVKGEYKDSLALENWNVDECKNLNKKFFHSFELYSKSKRPALFYFAELDSATWEFKKYFLWKYQCSKIWSDSVCSFIEIKGANHIFSGTESQQRLKYDILGWLKQFSR